MCIYIYIYMCIHIYIYIYMFIYLLREQVTVSTCPVERKLNACGGTVRADAKQSGHSELRCLRTRSLSAA